MSRYAKAHPANVTVFIMMTGALVAFFAIKAREMVRIRTVIYKRSLISRRFTSLAYYTHNMSVKTSTVTKLIHQLGTQRVKFIFCLFSDKNTTNRESA